ncbi:hypothetical protein M758_UG218400 [Ceratodon purpureus]|nr:hypothetical protein M758_UG218400 [Ceratodon purpureus]
MAWKIAGEVTVEVLYSLCLVRNLQFVHRMGLRYQVRSHLCLHFVYQSAALRCCRRWRITYREHGEGLSLADFHTTRTCLHTHPVKKPVAGLLTFFVKNSCSNNRGRCALSCLSNPLSSCTLAQSGSTCLCMRGHHGK